MSGLHEVLADAQVRAPVEVLATVIVVVREVHLGVTVMLLHANVPVEEDPIFPWLVPQPPKHDWTKLQGECGCHPSNTTVA